jgi:histidine triad (HIT) family protein
MTTPCVFCRILEGHGDASVVFEDDRVVALLDLFPVHAGHTLVVPKLHVSDVRDCPPDLAGHLFAVSARLAPVIALVTGADGFNIWTAAGRAAGQTVFHLHLHVLPRFEGDGFGPRLPKSVTREATRLDLEAIAARIRGAL